MPEHDCRYPAGDNWCQNKNQNKLFAYRSKCSSSLPTKKVKNEEDILNQVILKIDSVINNISKENILNQITSAVAFAVENISNIFDWLIAARFFWIVLIFIAGLAIFILKAVVNGIVVAIMFGLIGALFGEIGLIIGAILGFFLGFYKNLKRAS